MSTPQNVPPGGYVPPYSSYEQRRSGPGCWIWGLVSCLVVFVVVVVILAFVAASALRTPEGRKIVRSVTSAYSKGEEAAVALTQMEQVRGAIVRYHEKNGVYPPNLRALVPDYLDNADTLHTKLDTNTNPSHISFTYTRPKPDAPDTTVVLSFHWTSSIEIEDQTQTVDTEEDMELNGSTRHSQTQTMSTAPEPSSTPSP